MEIKRKKSIKNPHKPVLNKKTRTKQGKFKKGISGNPKGRPKDKELEIIKKLKQEIKEHGAELITAINKTTGKKIKLSRTLMIMDMMYKEAISNKNINAAKIYLEYTIGAPDQKLDANLESQFIFNFGIKKSPFIQPEDDK